MEDDSAQGIKVLGCSKDSSLNASVVSEHLTQLSPEAFNEILV